MRIAAVRNKPFRHTAADANYTCPPLCLLPQGWKLGIGYTKWNGWEIKCTA